MSEKSKTNKKWVSTEESRKRYDEIFRTPKKIEPILWPPPCKCDERSVQRLRDITIYRCLECGYVDTIKPQN